jgi:hypothetical protein
VELLVLVVVELVLEDVEVEELVLVDVEVEVELDVLVQVKSLFPKRKSDILFEFLNYSSHTSSTT